MNNKTNITTLVKKVLETYPVARDSDNKLYYLVCKKLNPAIDNYPFAHVLLNFNTLNLPNYETVGRVRRKLQERYPELAASKEVQKARSEKEQAFREYARNN